MASQQPLGHGLVRVGRDPLQARKTPARRKKRPVFRLLVVVPVAVGSVGAACGAACAYGALKLQNVDVGDIGPHVSINGRVRVPEPPVPGSQHPSSSRGIFLAFLDETRVVAARTPIGRSISGALSPRSTRSRALAGCARSP